MFVQSIFKIFTIKYFVFLFHNISFSMKVWILCQVVCVINEFLVFVTRLTSPRTLLHKYYFTSHLIMVLFNCKEEKDWFSQNHVNFFVQYITFKTAAIWRETLLSWQLNNNVILIKLFFFPDSCFRKTIRENKTGS